MKQKILLADDSPTIRRLVTQTFMDGNFEVVAVSNGEAAIKALEEERPGIVLADIYMPGKNGYEVCAYVRNHATLGATPVVLLVGAFDAFDEQVARQSGATANITKPFEPGALIELVKTLVPAGKEGEEEQVEAHRQEEEEPLPVRSPVVSGPAPGSSIVSSPAPASPVVSSPVPGSPVVSSPVPRSPILSSPSPVVTAVVSSEADDLLGLEALFRQEPEVESASGGMSDEDIDRIADRVIQRLSTQVIESIAWDIVPDITERIVREELKNR